MIKYTTIFFLLFFGLSSKGQEHVKAKTIYSKILEQKRQYSIQLPADYNTVNTKYPLVFLFDGHSPALSSMTGGLLRYMSEYSFTMPQVILVNVYQVERNKELLPSQNAKKFLAFMVKELLPEIQKKYRTCGFHLLLGHSNGGQFATYAQLQYPDIFQAVIAASPSMTEKNTSWYLNRFDSLLTSRKDLYLTYMTTMGTEGKSDSTFSYYTKAAEKQFSEKNYPGFKWSNNNLPGYRHMETPALSWYQALTRVFNEWNLPGTLIDSIAKGKCNDPYQVFKTHTDNARKRYHSEVYPSFIEYMTVLYALVDKKDLTSAEILFKESDKVYPRCTELYYGYAAVLESTGKYQEALGFYEKGFAYLSKDVINKEDFMVDIDRVKKLLQEQPKK